MEASTILAILALIAGLISFGYPRIEIYFIKRPKLVVEINPNKGFTRSSSFIDYHPDTDRTKPVNRPETIRIYELLWKFDLVIRNNSEINAFNVKMLQHKNATKLAFNASINPQKSLKTHEEVIIPFQFTKVIQSTTQEFPLHYTQNPSDFKDLMLLLEYENEFGRKFYSRYFFNTDKSKFYKTRKSELIYWS